MSILKIQNLLPVFKKYFSLLSFIWTSQQQNSLLLSPAGLHPHEWKLVLFWSSSGEAQWCGASCHDVTSQRQQLQLLLLIIILLLLIWHQWLGLQVKRTLEGTGSGLRAAACRTDTVFSVPPESRNCLLQCKKMYILGFFFFYKEDFYQDAHNGKECVIITTFLSWWNSLLFCFASILTV